LEHTAIFDALLQHKITGYYRYVDDILLVYDTRHTDINSFFNHFNTINKGIEFTLEQEQITPYTSSILPSPEQTKPFSSRYTGNQQQQLTPSFRLIRATQPNTK
jgi:hypothetical protein